MNFHTLQQKRSTKNSRGRVATSIDSDTVLEVKDLSVQYVLEDETVEAVNDVSFTIRKGSTLGLVGETGAGKTSTALAVLRLIPDPPGVIKQGTITLCGRDMLSLDTAQMSQVRGKDVSMIFQDPMTSLNPVFTVGEQIAESIEIHEQLSKKEAFERAQEMLEMVGIPKDRAHEYPHQFSGGMRQRVVIAIALACSPKLLIADEPTTALDVTIQAQVLELMQNLKTKYGTSMIIITHDLGIVAEICDEVAVMYAGRIIEQGTLTDVFNHTKHPYTEGLFNSLPKIGDRATRLKPIKGMMPDPTNLPVGCAFAPRCSYATAACKESQPTIHSFSETHFVRCLAYVDKTFRIAKEEIHE
jgi:peptide/nickel transport system ATP-binding protein